MKPATWLPDPSHYPEQMTPLSATVWFEAVGRGLHAAMEELRGPFAGFEARTELGWAYEGELEPEWTPDEEAIKAAALGLGDRWTMELSPRVHEITGELHLLRPERPAPKEAARMVDRMWELVQEQWKLHFLAVVPGQIAVQMLSDAYVRAFGESDALEPYRLLDGLANESNEADFELWRLAERSKELGVDDVLLEYPAETVIERLRELLSGRLWLSDLEGYLIRFGGRSRWHELSLPREAERPLLTLESIRLFLERGSAPDMARSDEARRHEAEALARDPDLAEVLEAAKTGYSLKESHVYHIDYPGLLATREVLLGFGRRFLAEGRLRDLADVWMLQRDEVRAAVNETDGASLEPLVQRRRQDLAQGAKEGPRSYLGEPPPDVERHAVLETFYGRSGTGVAGDALRGTGASPGVADGVARVVAGPADFSRVVARDVLVATTTTPAWTPLFPSLSGLVTETGGILSHAAIVAREYGLPAVVGVEGATRLIRDGSRVRLDGGSGDIRILDS